MYMYIYVYIYANFLRTGLKNMCGIYLPILVIIFLFIPNKKQELQFCSILTKL
jgi:hypothetical protein